jgi:leader peptidase HopD
MIAILLILQGLVSLALASLAITFSEYFIKIEFGNGGEIDCNKKKFRFFFFSFIMFFSIFFASRSDYLTLLLFVTIIFLLSIQSNIDFIIMMASDIVTIFIGLFCILLCFYQEVSVSIILSRIVFYALFFLTLSYLLNVLLKKDSLGLGDIKLFICLSMLFDFTLFTTFIGLCGILSLLHAFILAKCSSFKINNVKEFAFVPSISSSFALTFILKICS